VVTEVESPAALQKTLLDRLERQIDLPALLVARGFQIAPMQPDPVQLVMTGPAREVYHLRKDVDRGGWTYVNTLDPKDCGTVVDVMIRRDGATLATCVERLLGCAVRGQLSPEGLAYQEAFRDRGDTLHRAEAIHIAAVKAEREATRVLEHLGVDRNGLDEWRFGRIRSERDVAAILRDPSTLEHSRYRASDKAVVFIERPIDAIAYERRRGNQRACYVYTGDNPDGDTRRKVAHILAALPPGMTVVVALGRCRRSEELASEIAKVASTLPIERQKPELGSRWSDQMQMEHRHRRSRQRMPGMGR